MNAPPSNAGGQTFSITHHGARDGVTGSCHQFWVSDESSYLIDCGTFQGQDAALCPSPEIRFSLDGILGLLVTHVHVDHIGRIPYLMAAGFRKPIFCSPPTAKLLPLMLEDTLKVGFSRNKRLVRSVLSEIAPLLVPLEYHRWHDMPGNVKVKLTPAGHILGSTIFEIELPSGQRAVFSGDLGARNAPLMCPPLSPERADVLVLESTYGDKIHEHREDRQQQLQAVLEKTLVNRGVTIIPAFSLGRTQELLYELNGIFENLQKVRGESLLKRVDVIVDSPLANRLTDLYSDLSEYWGAEAQQVLASGDEPLVFQNLYELSDHEEHCDTLDHLDRRNVPAIVIAGSGMCTGGRVLNYLKRFLPDPTTDVVLIGYQAAGTPGRYIQQRLPWVRLDGQKVPIEAKVHTLSGYSAHADQADLLRFVEGFAERPKWIRLVHGEEEAKRVLAQELRSRGYEVD